MIIDSTDILDGTVLDADICVMGAGGAGITVCRELAKRELTVCLLEAGGLEFEESSQGFYEGRITGHPYPDPSISRLRYFGGSTNHWEGASHPLSELDFESKPWLPYSGWPISKSDLDPWYEKAHPYIEIGPAIYDPAYKTRHTGKIGLATDSSVIEDSLYRASPPTRFGLVFRDDLARNNNVRVVLHANVAEIVLNQEGGGVKEIRCARAQGAKFQVRAKRYVLAMGGLETPRMLLLSNSVRPEGIGNQNDLVGRFFMDHPVIGGAAFVPAPPFQDMSFYDAQAIEGFPTLARMFLSQEACRRHQLNNINVPFIPRSRYFASEGIEAAHRLSDNIVQGKLSGSASDIGKVFSNLDMIVEAISRKNFQKSLFSSSNDFAYYLMDTMTEQSPNPESRVTLSNDRDALGLRRIEVNWIVTQSDRDMLWRGLRVIANEVTRLGIGKVRLFEDRDEALWGGERYLGFAHHHMGTTRMSASSKTGVVDADCRVHGVNNLYVAGSSVFSTGGCVPPTLTIIALALRLADHLAKESLHG